MRNSFVVDGDLIVAALDAMEMERVLPFRFLSAARYAPQWEAQLEQAMFRAVADRGRPAGHAVILVDVYGSVVARPSGAV